jgi:hypothetical protein
MEMGNCSDQSAATSVPRFLGQFSGNFDKAARHRTRGVSACTADHPRDAVEFRIVLSIGGIGPPGASVANHNSVFFVERSRTHVPPVRELTDFWPVLRRCRD